MQHKIPDENTSETEHDARLFVDWHCNLATFYTSSNQWDPCETGIRGTCCKSTLKLR